MGAPWETVIDDQMDLRRWFYTHDGWLTARNNGPVTADGKTEEWLRADRTQPDILFVADSLWISGDVTALVNHAERTFVPEALSDADMLTPCGFALLERPIPLAEPWSNDAVSVQLAACSWSVTASPDGRRGVVWALYIQATHPDVWGAPFLPFFDSSFWPFGEKDPPGTFTRWLQCLWRFMLQTITVVAPKQPSRQLRRRIDRARWAQRCVQVVTLRRRRIELADGEHDGDSEREFSCRWLVNGHWRNQWFPSQEDHRQIWIDPYVKGPDGAPFKPTKRRVMMVTR